MKSPKFPPLIKLQNLCVLDQQIELNAFEFCEVFEKSSETT